MSQRQKQSDARLAALIGFLLPLVPLLCTSFLIEPVLHALLSSLWRIDDMHFFLYYLLAFGVQCPVFLVFYFGATENIELERKALLDAEAENKSRMGLSIPAQGPSDQQQGEQVVEVYQEAVIVLRKGATFKK